MQTRKLETRLGLQVRNWATPRNCQSTLCETVMGARTFWPLPRLHMAQAVRMLAAFKLRRKAQSMLRSSSTAVFRIETQVKYIFSARRPADYTRQVTPIIQTPSHSSFPSGHATESFAAAEVLGHMYYGGRNRDLRQLAERIAENRTFAGVHFPVDNIAGAVLGEAIGAYFADKFFGSTTTCTRDFALTDNGPGNLPSYDDLATFADMPGDATDADEIASGRTHAAPAGSVLELYLEESIAEISG